MARPVVADWNSLYSRFRRVEHECAERRRVLALIAERQLELDDWAARVTEKVMDELFRAAKSHAEAFERATGHAPSVTCPARSSIAGRIQMSLFEVSLENCVVDLYSTFESTKSGTFTPPSVHLMARAERASGQRQHHQRLVSRPGCVMTPVLTPTGALVGYRLRRADALDLDGSIDELVFRAFELLIESRRQPLLSLVDRRSIRLLGR